MALAYISYLKETFAFLVLAKVEKNAYLFTVLVAGRHLYKQTEAQQC